MHLTLLCIAESSFAICFSIYHSFQSFRKNVTQKSRVKKQIYFFLSFQFIHIGQLPSYAELITVALSQLSPLSFLLFFFFLAVLTWILFFTISNINECNILSALPHIFSFTFLLKFILPSTNYLKNPFASTFNILYLRALAEAPHPPGIFTYHSAHL